MTENPTSPPSTAPSGDALLQMSGIVKEFPGVRALDGVDLDVRAGYRVRRVHRPPARYGMSVTYTAAARITPYNASAPSTFTASLMRQSPSLEPSV